jgi:hypothetical protein
MSTGTPPAIMLQLREADDSSPSNSEDKNMCSVTFTSPLRFPSVELRHRYFTFTYIQEGIMTFGE